MFVYGQVGVPESDGDDGECGGFFPLHEEAIDYTVFKSTEGMASTGALIGWPYAERYVACDEPATVLVDWTTDPPEPTYLLGGDCDLFATGDMTKGGWHSWGTSNADFKFVHTDNLVDALVHLVS